MVSDRIAALRALMKKKGIDAYMIPTDDYHASEYVGEYFKCRQYMTAYRVSRDRGHHAGHGRYVDRCAVFYSGGTPNGGQRRRIIPDAGAGCADRP